MYRKFLILMMAFVVVFTLGAAVIAQDATEEAATIEPWVCPEDFSGQTLSLFNWATYVAEDTIPNFEELCNVTVEVAFYGSNAELLTAMRLSTSDYDVIVPSDTTVGILASEGLLAPLDHENIPNMANVTPALMDTEYDPGNVYSVPYQWGTVGVGYNAGAVEEVLGEGTEITSWNQVFDYPERSVVWIDDSRIMLGTALDVLGYDPNSMNEDEINAAKDFLIEKGSQNVVAFHSDNGQELLARGEADLVIEYMGDIFQIKSACEEDPACDDEFVYALPEEGANIWVDNLAIPAEAPNKRLAEAFIDYVLHPQVGADISNYTAYASPNQAAIDAGLIDPVYGESPIIYPSADIMPSLYYLRGFVENPEVEQFYNDAWDEVKIAIGA